MLDIVNRILISQSKKKDIFIFTLLILTCFTYVFWNLIDDFNSYIISYIKDDGVTIFLDLRQYLKNQLEAGRFPLWYPLDYLGVPFFGNQETGILHLPTLFSVYFFPILAAFNIEVLLMLYLGGLFFFMWARYEHRRSFIASTLGAFVFTFMGQHISFLYEGGLSNLNTITWIPLCFFTFERLSRTKKLIDTLYGSIALFMLVVSGHGEFTYYTCLTLFFWGIYNLVKAKHTERKGLLLIYSFTSIWAVFLSLVQLSSIISMISESTRSSGVKFKTSWIDQLHFKSFLSLISYGILGTKHITTYGQSLFLGITGSLFFVFSFSFLLYKKTRFYVIAVVILLIIAAGTNTIFPFLSIRNFIPGMNLFRNPIFFTFIAFTFLSLLISYSSDIMIKRKTLKFSALLLLVLGFTLLFLSYYSRLNITPIYLGDTIFLPNTFYLRESAFFSILSGIAIVALVKQNLSKKYAKFVISFFIISELVFNAPKAIQFSHKEDIAPKEFNDQIKSNLGPYSRIYIIQGCWGENLPKVMGLHLPSQRFASYISYGAYQNFTKSDESTYTDISSLPKNHLKYMRYSGYCINSKPYYRGAIFPDNKNFRRFHLYNKWETIENKQQALSKIFSKDFNIFKQIVIEDRLTLIPDKIQVGHKYDIKYLGGNNDKYRVKVSTNTNAIFLITDSYSKDWHARNLINGKQYKITPGQYIYQAIPLEKGNHEIELYYRPKFFYQSITISFITFLLSLCYIFYCLWSRNDTKKKIIN